MGTSDAFGCPSHQVRMPQIVEPKSLIPSVQTDGVEPIERARAIEVMVLWGDAVLHVQHLTPPRAFYLGETQGRSACDFQVPAAKLGATRVPLVLVRQRSSIDLVILPHATGSIELPGQGRLEIMDIRNAIGTRDREGPIPMGDAQPCAECPGACQIPLPLGGKARIEIGDLVFRLAVVAGRRTVPVGWFASSDSSAYLHWGLSLLAHAGLMGALAAFAPPLGLAGDEGLRRERLELIQHYLQAAAPREHDRGEADIDVQPPTDEDEGGTGRRASGEEGPLGARRNLKAHRRYGVHGPMASQDPHVARQAALQEATEFGMIGLVSSGAGSSGAPSSSWGREDSLGSDALNAQGNMWGDAMGDAFGAGGLGLTGIGQGGGGRGEGIGLGHLGGLGHGEGIGRGQGFGRLQGRHATGPIVVCGTLIPRRSTHKSAVTEEGAGVSNRFEPSGTYDSDRTIASGCHTLVDGRLPPEAIQRVVRQNFGRFRLCYENGLRNNPSLEGRVAVRFVIGRDGSVSHAANGESDLPDASVVACVVRAYYGLSFPVPAGGIVTVVYPISFSMGV